MITKFEVRALALARLGPRLGDLVWDVGAGSGSVAVECARLGAAVVAVEKAPDGVERIHANARAHGVDVRVVHGSAPDALGELDDPDAVFIGGGGVSCPPSSARARAGAADRRRRDGRPRPGAGGARGADECRVRLRRRAVAVVAAGAAAG